MATQKQQDDFINAIAPKIQLACRVYGYGVPSAIIAQAICESNWGLSGLAKYHNYFGLKCGSSWKGASVNMKTKEEYTVGTLTTIKDNFRAYADMQSGVNGYFEFIKTTRYSATRAQKTPREYLTAIKLAGYATSSTYVNTNMNIVNTYNLTRFDNIDNIYIHTEPTVSTVVSEPEYDYTVGKVYTVQVRLNVRSNPVDGDVLKVYPIGTRCTCKELSIHDGNVWMRTPSGWICTEKGGKKYVK